MRILMTGMTIRQCNAGVMKPRIRWCPILDILRDVLREEHEVDHRMVQVGEDLSDYDLVWTAVMSANSLAGRHSPSALWAMTEAQAKGIPLVVYIDDWNTPSIAQGFRVIANGGVKQLGKKFSGGAPFYLGDYDKILEYADEMQDTARRFHDRSSGFWSRAILGLCLFRDWGDEQILVESLGLGDIRPMFNRFDPSPIVRPMLGTPEGVDLKERKWMLAGLSDAHLRWVKEQKLGWPVDYYGPGKLSTHGVLRSEPEVTQEYSRRWGGLIPVYPHSGSGWWRPRWFSITEAGSVVYANSADAGAVGGPFAATKGYIESLNDSGLGVLSNGQREYFDTLVERDVDQSKQAILRTVGFKIQ